MTDTMRAETVTITGHGGGVDRTRCSENREDIAQALEQATVLLVRHLADRQGLSITSS
jgi:hypothetical protein